MTLTLRSVVSMGGCCCSGGVGRGGREAAAACVGAVVDFFFTAAAPSPPSPCAAAVRLVPREGGASVAVILLVSQYKDWSYKGADEETKSPNGSQGECLASFDVKNEEWKRCLSKTFFPHFL